MSPGGDGRRGGRSSVGSSDRFRDGDEGGTKLGSSDGIRAGGVIDRRGLLPGLVVS